MTTEKAPCAFQSEKEVQVHANNLVNSYVLINWYYNTAVSLLEFCFLLSFHKFYRPFLTLFFRS